MQENPRPTQDKVCGAKTEEIKDIFFGKLPLKKQTNEALVSDLGLG